MANGEIFAPPAISVIRQIGFPSASTVKLFVELSVPGAVPKLHTQLAPLTTATDIY
jgi:hypothetical protein